MFAISCAFAGPTLALSGAESGGFHFVGQSSSGKTTALRAAASVSGNPDQLVHPWRATANGMEGLAALYNDGLLILDEIQQYDHRQAGEVIYLLGNGKGKTRASRMGCAKESASWLILFLSSGEISLRDMVEGQGKTLNAGQELRLADIQADAGMGLGMSSLFTVRTRQPHMRSHSKRPAHPPMVPSGKSG
jgi:putative DNA primase/helicase